MIPAPPMHIGRGIALAVLSFGLYSTMDMLIKRLSSGYPLAQIVFCLGIFGLLPLLAALKSTQATLVTRKLRWHLLRGLIGFVGSFGSFFAYSRMPLADAYAIAFSAPMFVTALSVPLLGEQVGWRRWAAVAVGFGGVLIMLRPGQNTISAGSLGALTGALCYAFSVLLLRHMSRTESMAAQMFYPTLVSITASGLIMPFVYVPPSWADMGWLFLTGLCGGLGQLCLIGAFRAAPAVVVAPFQYTQMLWGVLYGYFIWSTRPDRSILLGAAIVVGSGLYILHRETRRHPSVSTAAKGTTAVGAPVLPP